ncbi:hypothetical protein DWQ65_01350 [Treponema phagedenis]|nr:hypothetical protein DWQ65_01350 [Treponema phagedenis]
MSKTNPRVLKLCKQFCFKTSFLLGTTAVHGGSELYIRVQCFTMSFALLHFYIEALKLVGEAKVAIPRVRRCVVSNSFLYNFLRFG